MVAKVLPAVVRLKLLAVNGSPLAVGTGTTFAKAQEKLNRAVKRRFPSLFQLDLNQMAESVSKDSEAPNVTVTSHTETFRLSRINVFVPQV